VRWDPLAHLFLSCACHATRVLEAPVNRVQLAVDLSGWNLATVGDVSARDTCPKCQKEENAHA
jgi:hypothetical protein